MKGFIVTAILFVTMLTGFSSCKKCVTCQMYGGRVKDMCSKDFPDGTAGLNLTVDEYEKQGYTCQEQ